jgi:HAD superfamily hydrolase (TIGR01459 family)
MLARGLKMICANPDKVVRIGRELVPCAGAIAEVYAAMGGEVLMAGKPYAPIYDEALQRAGSPPRGRVMVIGDGPETDLAGAVAQNLPCLFVTGGINHEHEAEARARAKFPAARILATMPELEWT